jgi:hypothetical protein
MAAQLQQPPAPGHGFNDRDSMLVHFPALTGSSVEELEDETCMAGHHMPQMEITY